MKYDEECFGVVERKIVFVKTLIQRVGTLYQKAQLTVQYIIVECFPVDVGRSSALSGERLQGGRSHFQHGGDVQQGPAERMERATAEHPPPGQLALQRRHSPHHTLAGRHQ